MKSETPLISIKEEYYTRLHKTNEALALSEFKSNTHECTLLGLRGISNKPKLTNMLRRAKKEKNVDYFMDPKKSKTRRIQKLGKFHRTSNEPISQEIKPRNRKNKRLTKSSFIQLEPTIHPQKNKNGKIFHKEK